MRLSDCTHFVPMTVIRDGEFQDPGLLADPQPGMLAFIEDRRYLSSLRRLAPRCVVASPALVPELQDVPGLAVSPSPRDTFFELHNHLARHTTFYWVDFPTAIDPTAVVHPTAWVAPRSVRIGPRSVVEAHATVLERCTIGADVVVQPGAVLGGTGLQLSRSAGRTLDLLHAGSVVIEDEAQLMSHAVVARAVFRQATRVGRGARIGNHAFLSHNVQVGAGTVVAHGAVINGNVVLGRDCWIGPGAVVTNCVRVGDGARVSLGATVVRDVGVGQRVSGNFAVEHRLLLKHLARLG